MELILCLFVIEFFFLVSVGSMPDPSDSSDFEDENLAPSVVQVRRLLAC